MGEQRYAAETRLPAEVVSIVTTGIGKIFKVTRKIEFKDINQVI